MATNDFLFEEGKCILEPPMLVVADFDEWCFNMEMFLMSIDFKLWDIVVDGSCGSQLCESELCANKSRLGLNSEYVSLNLQACAYLIKSLNCLQSSLFISCKCANIFWMRLQELYGKKEEASTILIEDFGECLLGLKDDASFSNE